jgi:hypothetical protein
MTKLVNRAKMTTATTGTGTLTLGSAVDGYQTFANAGVANADIVRYVIEDGDAWEIGLGTYTASGTTLTRGSIESSNADAALNLTGNAVVYVSAAAADLQELVDFADNFVLPTADGSTGQVLTTNGAGTLSFTTIEGYTDADVDAHLNTGTAASGEVLSWTGSDYDWIAAPAALTGQTDSASPFETSLGVGAGAVSTGVNNTFIGFEAGNDVTTGNNNAVLGFRALDAATSGAGNVAVGSNSGGALTTGSNNVAIGNGALDAATTGGRNIAIGQDAMGLGVATSATGDNIAIGFQAGYDITSASNAVFIGERAGENLTTGGNNIGIGYRSMAGSTAGFTGASNVGVGFECGQGLTNGGSNSILGHAAGTFLSTGSNNVIAGALAGYNVTTGSENVIIGRNAAFSGTNNLTTGVNNIIVGDSAAASSATVSNEITLGNSSITTLRCQVTTITSLSDARDKTDIQPLKAGLDFVETLNPVSFTWNMRDGGKVGEADTGFIAQDLQTAQADTGVTIPGLVFDANPEKLEAGYGKLIPVLVQAIKDLSAEVKTLKAQLEAK